MPVPQDLEYNGPNAALVREDLDFAFSSRILSGGSATSEAATVTSDIERAVDAAGFTSGESNIKVAYGGDGIVLPESWPYEGEIKWSECDSWTDLRQNLIAEYIQTTDWYSWEEQHESEIKKCESLAVKWTADSPMYLHDHLEKILPEGPVGPDESVGYYRDFVVNEVACDLMECCKNRAFNGQTNNFWERLLSLYSQGYWPCCWLGSWPADGRFLAWNPNNAT